jgi:NADPH:quinone reductase-like Zn-dependent oxidoreductase
VEEPAPGAGEVVVKIAAAGINPSDVKNVQGMMGHTTLPRTPGRDFAGTVTRGPAELIGVEVWGSGGELGFSQDGSHAQYLLLPRQGVGPKPQSLSMEEAAAVGVPFITAWAALVEAGRVTAEDTVAILGTAGAVGSAAVQIAHWRGARVIGIVRDEAQHGAIRAFGAEVIVNNEPAALADALKAATGGRGATLILDTVGGAMFEPCLHSLANSGRQVAIATSPRRVEFDLLDFYRRELTLYGVNTLTLDSAAGARVLTELVPGFESGALRAPSIVARYTLDDIVLAYNAAANGGGKRLIVP